MWCFLPVMLLSTVNVYQKEQLINAGALLYTVFLLTVLRLQDGMDVFYSYTSDIHIMMVPDGRLLFIRAVNITRDSRGLGQQKHRFFRGLSPVLRAFCWYPAFSERRRPIEKLWFSKSTIEGYNLATYYWPQRNRLFHWSELAVEIIALCRIDVFGSLVDLLM